MIKRRKVYEWRHVSIVKPAGERVYTDINRRTVVGGGPTRVQTAAVCVVVWRKDSALGVHPWCVNPLVLGTFCKINLILEIYVSNSSNHEYVQLQSHLK